ncbi:MAG: nucleoside-diphosphate kinase [Candidatus Harrisonbacteria bacterium CG10_big_fil_rev_8_21_14_0_10_42_17]|uniref:Nucleoside diphosphate kinase n=1 Tax=Candidatus Harrisonbacteria bacterium CG10_big_fil_rev_8_21_14_0_10_42_17 TaxID=1974584 RepID=A0A2M6WIY4_9BACT|nr:MAG: nucleoside-diphosphate kinase [Candidatus Harrisonbacteria bacterium CG10_big_fil_rev_8_21_14_0_10_42_17]
MNHPKEEKTLILIKPDALQRNLFGEIVQRFERKGLKIIGIKMMHLNETILREHYKHHAEKPFFKSLAGYMSSSPIIAIALSGVRAVSAVRLIVGPTKGHAADAGSIRGDFSMSGQSNLVHASDPDENPEEEVKRFFNDDELFSYHKIDFDLIYGAELKD